MKVAKVPLLAFSFSRFAPDEHLSDTQRIDWSFYESHQEL